MPVPLIFPCLPLPLCRTAGRGFRVPDEVFVAIETLLPNGKGKFLELWAEQGVQRQGWAHVVEATEKT